VRPAAGAPPRLLESAGFRFAVAFAGLFALAFVALLGLLWWATAGAVDRQTDAALRADALALAERYREGGAEGVREAIAERLAVDVDGEAIYLLVDADGTRLAGNLDGWPRGFEEELAFFRTRVLHDGTEAEARLLRRDVGMLRVLVGRDETERQQLRQLLAEGLLWASGVVFVFALAGAALMRRMLEERLRPAFATTAAIAAGDLGSRVPVSGRGDEFDRLGATLNITLDRIAALMDGVRGVSDAVAHDLRTPIARARARLEAALASGEGSLQPAVEQAIGDLDQVTRIFQALLRIAETEAGARRAAFAPIDLVPVLEDAAEFYAAAAEARGQRLETALPSRLDLVGDRDLLLQAVANLLDNAIKFAPDGGVIRLAATTDPDAAAVSVTDDGPGLSVPDQARAGERFFRADAARATPGSGLGLSLVRAVAAAHGGALRLADARPGQDPPGLRATLHLPIG